MHVREALLQDIVGVTGLIQDFYSEQPLECPPINVERSKAIIGALVAAQAVDNNAVFLRVIADDDGGLHGMIIAERVQDLWTDEKVVCEYFIFTSPAQRGTLCAGRLLLTFKKWAEAERCVIRVSASSGIKDAHAAGVFVKLGWEPRGLLFGTEVY
mgnify:CR=1 FL=1|tara:strand:+ start:8815 stop:9282 length:468 start_codon:yes stop_codon:yes gene_type:complete